MDTALALHAQPYKYYQGKDWRDVMTNSRVSLTPRGFGRSAYHVTEILQSGLIPLYVYDDTPWIPYATLFHEKKLGYSSTVEGLPDMLRVLRKMSDSDFTEQEARIASYRESHFLPAGVLQQISMFMTRG
jgi:hypothetical protein